MLLTEEPSSYLTAQEVAAILRYHPDTVLRLLRRKIIPGEKIGKEWRINRQDLDAHMRKPNK